MMIIMSLLLCSALSARPILNAENFDACLVCQVLVSTVEKAMESTTVIEEIEKIILPICATFKQPISATCEALIKEYLPQIMKWLDEKLTNAEICKKLKFCVEKPANALNDDDNCQFCQLVASSLISYLGEATNIQEIKDFINKQLIKFPIQIQVAIKPILDTYFDIGVQYLIFYLQTGNPCKDLGFCQ